MLDIGCGWGSLAIWAAQHYGVRAHGVTLSQGAGRMGGRADQAGGARGALSGRVPRLRDLPADARYDKIAAIGVIEHVGITNYPAFFGRVREMLKDGGLYLNHGIHHEFHWKRTSQTDFLYRYVFPNGDLSGVTETLTEMERAGWELLDVENLRLHYARTCREWAERLQGPRGRGARASSASGCTAPGCSTSRARRSRSQGGSIGLYQVLMRKQWDRARGTVPTTREGIYAGW